MIALGLIVWYTGNMFVIESKFWRNMHTSSDRWLPTASDWLQFSHREHQTENRDAILTHEACAVVTYEWWNVCCWHQETVFSSAFLLSASLIGYISEQNVLMPHWFIYFAYTYLAYNFTMNFRIIKTTWWNVIERSLWIYEIIISHLYVYKFNMDL